jgi:agmatine/peptidylarginine deiminase
MKVRFLNSLSIIAAGFLGAGCSTGSDHVAAEPAASQPRIGGLEVIPEYDVSTGMMISHHLAQEEEMMPFLLDVLKRFELFVFMPRDHKGREDRRLEPLYEAIENSAPEDLRSRLRSRVQPFGSAHAPNFYRGGREPWERGVWARDWGPLSARFTGEGNRGEGGLAYLDFNYHRSRAYQGSAPLAFVEFLGSRTGGTRGGVAHRNFPIRNPGGNVTVGGNAHLLLAEGKFLKGGSGTNPDDGHRHARQVVDEIRDGLQCRRASLFEAMPHEETGHIDVWAKFLSDDAVLVAALEDSQRSLVPGKHAAVFDEIQAYLDQRADDIEKLGYRVVRVPSPVPVFKANRKFMIRSYVNTLFLVHGDGRRFAYVPRYRKPAVKLPGRSSEYPDADLLENYEREVARVFGDAGYRVMFVPADDLISKDGAIHCVTMQARAP